MDSTPTLITELPSAYPLERQLLNIFHVFKSTWGEGGVQIIDLGIKVEVSIMCGSQRFRKYRSRAKQQGHNT